MAEYIRVSELNRLAKQVLERCEPLASLIVLGEISGFTRHYKSGHCYFTLKDENAAVKTVLFRDKARLLGFEPQDGMLVLAWGRATIYERDGAFQLYAEYLRPFGAGAAQMAFDALKAKLQAEGLFETARKRPLPPVPKCIGIVTSKTGAALQDVRNVIGRRWPLTKLLLAPVSVQGMQAEGEIEAAIRTLDADPRPDLILVTRGGGSREDLWVFNSERIARAAAACCKPLVSAVGHEIDYTILDYVADLRAPTPSAAAELCVPDIAAARLSLREAQKKMQKSIQSCLNVWYNNTLEIETALAKSNPSTALKIKQQALADTAQAVNRAANARLHAAETALQSAAAVAASLDPYAVLGRGYALVTDNDGAPLPVEELKAGQSITVRGRRAWADCTVQKIGKGEKRP